MTRGELEHAIRAACDVAGDDQVFVFGSQAILGQYPDAHEALRQSAEADISPVRALDKVDDIDACLGELSPFHEAYGFYVHGVSIEAAVPPAGWQRHAIRVRNANTGHKTGGCVEAHDLAASKLVAFRDKDRNFVRVLLTEQLIKVRTLKSRLGRLPTSDRVTPAAARRTEGLKPAFLRPESAHGALSRAPTASHRLAPRTGRHDARQSQNTRGLVSRMASSTCTSVMPSLTR